MSYEVYQLPSKGTTVIFFVRWIEKEIIGTYFFENKNKTGESSKNILRYYAFSRLRDYRESTIFQQDGTSLHYAIQGRK